MKKKLVAGVLGLSLLVNSAGVLAAENGTSWKQESGNWYLYNGSQKTTGWQYVNGAWYYLNQSGVMQTGWKMVNGKWYYLENSGVMKTGWKQTNGKWYFLNADGSMHTGWKQDKDLWYYFSQNGAMTTGWTGVNGKYYYLNEDGSMVTGSKKIDGKEYDFGESGELNTLPEGLDKNLVASDVKYNPVAFNNLPLVQHSVSKEAQALIKDVNSKYNTDLKYKEIGGVMALVDKNMFLAPGTISGQFVVDGSKDDFDIIFLDNNKATIELTKKWVTLLNPDLHLDKEIQETIDAKTINNYEQKGYKIRVGQATGQEMMYIQVEK